MIKVNFRNHHVQNFNADSTDFDDIRNNVVRLKRDGEVVTFLNWEEILFISRVG